MPRAVPFAPQPPRAIPQLRTRSRFRAPSPLRAALAVLACGALLAPAGCKNAAPTGEPAAAPTSFDLRPTSREAVLAADAVPTWDALLTLLAERADRKAVQVVDFPRRATCRVNDVEIRAAVDALDVGSTRVRLWTQHPLRFDRDVAGVLLDELAARLGLPAPPLQAVQDS